MFLSSVQTNSETLMKPIGSLYVYGDEYVIKFEENLRAYYENAEALKNNTKVLAKMCDNLHTPNCPHYKKQLEDISEAAMRELQFFKANNRSKRELLCFLVAMVSLAIASAVISFVAGIAVAIHQDRQMVEQQNLVTNTTMGQLDLSMRGLAIQNISISMQMTEQKQIKELSDIEHMNQIMITSLLAADKHNQNTKKYIEMLGPNLKRTFFSFIDIDTFSRTFSSVKFSSPLKELHPRDVIQLSSLDSELINDTIIINVRIPMLIKSKFELLKLIPIPIKRDHNIFIQNFEPKHLIRLNSMMTIIAEIPVLAIAQCTQIKKLVVCHNTVLNQLKQINSCVEAILYSRSTEGLCTYTKLRYKSQLIQITDESIYVYINFPILLRISCGDSSNVFNVTQSGELFYKQNCKIDKPNNAHAGKINATIVKIASNFIKPNFEVFRNGTWHSENFLPNQLSKDMNELLGNAQALKENFEQKSTMVDVMNLNPFSIFSDFFDQLIYYAIIFVTSLIICILLIIACCFICRK